MENFSGFFSLASDFKLPVRKENGLVGHRGHCFSGFGFCRRCWKKRRAKSDPPIS